MLNFKTKNNLETTFKILFVIIIILITAGCSKLLTDLPSAPDVTTHNEDINDPNSQNNHAYQVVNAINGMNDCQQCHGGDYSGGIVDIGCNTINCHPSIIVHVGGIIDPSSDDFHGNHIASHSWEMIECQSCHGSDYAGGIASPSCLDCHTNTGGPEACNTCHGDFNDITFIAPPRDVNKNTVTDSAGVGAHIKHLYDNQLGSQILCSTCHKVPGEVYEEGHVDSDLPAEIIFGNLAIHDGGANASYNFSDATCSDVYCHGSYEFLRDSAGSNSWIYTDSLIVGNAYAPIWNKVDGSEAVCGTCHLLPPTGHQNAGNDPDATTCVNCHPGVVDASGNIIDQTKHINGMKNVFGN